MKEEVSFQLKTKNNLEPGDNWEFPTRLPKNVNGVVLMHQFPYAHYHVEEITKIAKRGRIRMPVRLSFIGELRQPDPDRFFRDKFLFKFGRLINETDPREANHQFPGIFKEAICLIEFKTLFLGYQLFKNDFKQFKKLIKKAKNEKEFCMLAGVS